MEKLTCHVCGEQQTKDKFPPRWQNKTDSDRVSRRRPMCSACELGRYLKSKHKNYQNYLRYLVGKARTRSKKTNNISFKDLTEKHLIELFQKQNGLCAVSKLPLTWTHDEGHTHSGTRRGTNISLDRIDPEGPYSKDNVRLVCDRVNKIKSNMNDDDLYFWCAQIASSIRS